FLDLFSTVVALWQEAPGAKPVYAGNRAPVLYRETRRGRSKDYKISLKATTSSASQAPVLRPNHPWSTSLCNVSCCEPSCIALLSRRPIFTTKGLAELTKICSMPPI